MEIKENNFINIKEINLNFKIRNHKKIKFKYLKKML